MKTSISAVLLLLICMQVSLVIADGSASNPADANASNPADANASKNQCKAALTELRKKSRKFVDSLKQTLESNHNTLGEIVQLDAKLFKIEHQYLSNNYAKDGKATRVALKSFVDGLAEPSTKLSNFVKNVEADCDKLLKLADDFAKENNLKSRPQKASKGCEAELSTLQSELFDLLKELKTQREKAVASIKVMKSTISDLGGMVKKFGSADLTGKGKESDCELLAAANPFYVKFNQKHWTGYKEFVSLQFICGEITNRVSAFDVKLKCTK